MRRTFLVLGFLYSYFSVFMAGGLIDSTPADIKQTETGVIIYGAMSTVCFLAFYIVRRWKIHIRIEARHDRSGAAQRKETMPNYQVIAERIAERLAWVCEGPTMDGMDLISCPLCGATVPQYMKLKHAHYHAVRGEE